MSLTALLSYLSSFSCNRTAVSGRRCRTTSTTTLFGATATVYYFCDLHRAGAAATFSEATPPRAAMPVVPL